MDMLWLWMVTVYTISSQILMLVSADIFIAFGTIFFFTIIAPMHMQFRICPAPHTAAVRYEEMIGCFAVGDPAVFTGGGS